jgi:hypothetical protein
MMRTGLFVLVLGVLGTVVASADDRTVKRPPLAAQCFAPPELSIPELGIFDASARPRVAEGGKEGRVKKANDCCQGCLDKFGTTNAANCGSSTSCGNKNGKALESCRDKCSKSVMSCTSNCVKKHRVDLGDANVCYNAQS